MYKTERFNSIIMLNRLMSQFTTKIYFIKKEHFKFIYVNTKNVKNLHLPNLNRLRVVCNYLHAEYVYLTSDKDAKTNINRVSLGSANTSNYTKESASDNISCLYGCGCGGWGVECRGLSLCTRDSHSADPQPETRALL